MKIVRAINVYTNETHEGTVLEVSNAIYSDPDIVRKAEKRGSRVDNEWVIDLVGDTNDLPDYRKRLGLEKPCIICGKIFVANRATTVCCSKECTKKNNNNKMMEIHRSYRSAATARKQTNTLDESANEADKKCMKKKRAVIKKQSVCKGCRYHMKNCTLAVFRNTCDYLSQTGQSRIVVEMENGGVQTDSCICYEAGRYRDRGKQPMHIKK